ncbi:MAG: hypothetical protein JXQ96_06365 [Cyclobacteriaceae bacterium]
MNKKAFISSLLLMLMLHSPWSGFGQIKTSVTFTNPWVKNIQAVDKERKEYKKYLNDSIREYKRLNKYYAAKIDSLAQARWDGRSQGVDLSLNNFQELAKFKKLRSEYIRKRDSLENLPESSVAISDLLTIYESRIDSIESLIFDAEILGYRLGQVRRTNDFNSLFQVNYKGDYDLDSMEYSELNPDSLLIARMSRYLEDMAYSLAGVSELQRQQQRILAEQQRLEDYKADFNRYRDKKNLKSNLTKLSRSELLSKNETLNNAHKTLSSYKRKYLTLPSSKHLEGGIKRNSLEGKSFWERIKVGGNLRISQRDFVEIDFSPSIAYLANKKWAIGTEFVFRGEFGNGRKWYSAFDSDTYGGRVFTDYVVYKSFFAHAELENLYTIRKPTGTETTTTESVPGAMAGMGKTFGLGKNINGKVLIQYNFIHDEHKQLYASPWVIRFGFDVKKIKDNK